jgi:TolB protein
MFGKIKLFSFILLATALALAGCKQQEEPADQRGLRLPESPLLTFLERKSGLIAYVGIDRNIYVVNQTGSNPVQITSDADLEGDTVRYYQFPTWSPDSQSLAFYSVTGSTDADVIGTIHVVNSKGENGVEAYQSEAGSRPIYLSWSPDSANVSFIATIPGGNSLALNMVPAAGGDVTLLDTGTPYYWDWRPDSAGMLIHAGGARNSDPTARLSFLNLTDGVVEDGLLLRPSPFQSPAFSPDGAQLLLAAENGEGKHALLLTDLLGEVQTELATFETSVAFGWSPDGKRVAFINSADPAGTVGKLNFVEVSDPSKTVEADQEDIIAFYWSPDSKKVAYFVPMQTDDGSGGTLTYLKMYAADAATGKSTFLWEFVPTREFFQTVLFFDQYSRSATIWSPDSQNLVIPMYFPQENAAAIILVPASGNTQPRLLQEGTMAFWSWK